jgi:hypothetical protein
MAWTGRSSDRTPGDIIADMSMLREQGDLGAGRIWKLAQPLLTNIRRRLTPILSRTEQQDSIDLLLSMRQH